MTGELSTKEREIVREKVMHRIRTVGECVGSEHWAGVMRLFERRKGRVRVRL